MHCNVEYAKQLHVDIFCWGSGAPTIWISKGPKQNLKGPSIETHHQFFIFFLLLIFFNFIYLFLFIYFSFFICLFIYFFFYSQGPHWIFRGPEPLPPALAGGAHSNEGECPHPLETLSSFEEQENLSSEKIGMSERWSLYLIWLLCITLVDKPDIMTSLEF